MGRFGDVLLVNGEPDLTLTARAGEVVRLYLVNTANTRVFNVAIPGARMKLVGGDSGRYEREQFVETVMLAPSERVVVDVQFAEPGPGDAGAPHPRADLPAGRDHRHRRSGGAAHWPTSSPRCGPTRTWSPNGSGSAPDAGRGPGQDGRVRRRDGHGRTRTSTAAVIYVCPMHPEVTSDRTRPVPGLRDETARRRRRPPPATPVRCTPR